MTIAIGMLCDGGAIICADTKATNTDGSVTYASKVSVETTDFGSIVIANSSNDANAAKSLISRLNGAFKHCPAKKWEDIEDTVSLYMTEWSNAFGERDHPPTSLVIAANLKPLGVRVYFCEPPTTVNSAKVDGYVAAGGGTVVTDSLYNALFYSELNMYQHPQKTMRMLAYLMYRAKRDHALCGGRTQAVYVRRDGDEPEYVRSMDFDAAEQQSSKLDFLLQSTAKFALFSDEGENLQNNARGLGEFLVNLAGLRAAVFHAPSGETIVPPLL